MPEDLNKNIKRLEEIAEWFSQQKEVDLEQGLKLIKESAELIKTSNKRLKEVDNKFQEIKRDIEQELGQPEE